MDDSRGEVRAESRVRIRARGAKATRDGLCGDDGTGDEEVLDVQ